MSVSKIWINTDEVDQNVFFYFVFNQQSFWPVENNEKQPVHRVTVESMALVLLSDNCKHA